MELDCWIPSFRRRLPRVLCLVCCVISTSTLPFAWLLRFGVCSCFLLHCFSAALSVCRINSAEGFETLEIEAFRESDMSRARDAARAREPYMISSACDLRRLRSGDMGSRRLHVCWHVALLDTAHVGKFDLCVTLLHVLLPIEDHWTWFFLSVIGDSTGLFTSNTSNLILSGISFPFSSVARPSMTRCCGVERKFPSFTSICVHRFTTEISTS